MTTYVTPTTLSAVVPRVISLNPGTIAITVTNPAPGGGTSAAKNLIVGCDTRRRRRRARRRRYGHLARHELRHRAADVALRGQQLVRSDRHRSREPAAGSLLGRPEHGGTTVTLSAWADCSADGKEGDAYLTFYRRPTVPANDTERLACTGVIAEGISVSGYSSPESGASSWCPGLTKANGGGIALAACEKAVVHIQPWSNTSTTFTAPPTVRVKPE